MCFAVCHMLRLADRCHTVHCPLQGLTMLIMYLLGTVSALVAAAMLKRTVLRGPSSPLLIELPAYRMPTLRGLATSVGHRVMAFVRRAGTIIRGK